MAHTSVTVDHPLEHADGLELVGEFQQSGYKDPPSIVRLASGQTVQLTELLYVVLSCIDGQRDLPALAEAVSEKIGKTASADDVRFLAEEKLRPLGLLKEPDGSDPLVEKPDPLLGIKGRFTLANEKTTRWLTSPFRVLFLPPIVLTVLGAFVAMVGWLFFGEGLAGATRQLLYSPSMLVLTFVLTAASAGFHEFGHAAACRYGGAQPGVIGGGVYLVWPAFFTDVTDSYRLSRGGRLRTDLGGLYFNMLFALATAGAWAITHYDPLLVLVPLQIFQMTHQLMPFVRLDGYYILADLTGVP
ncbi:MAG: putative peptide zinc metalloprotease protein, partial [Actinomycetota bacterium]